MVIYTHLFFGFWEVYLPICLVSMTRWFSLPALYCMAWVLEPWLGHQGSEEKTDTRDQARGVFQPTATWNLIMFIRFSTEEGVSVEGGVSVCKHPRKGSSSCLSLRTLFSHSWTLILRLLRALPRLLSLAHRGSQLYQYLVGGEALEFSHGCTRVNNIHSLTPGFFLSGMGVGCTTPWRE